MAEKLVCDRCGVELTDRESVVEAFEGKDAWEAAVRVRGGEPRGVFPCQDFRNCGGEMKLFVKRWGAWRARD